LRLVVSLFLLAAIVYLVPQSWCLAQESYWKGKGEDSQELSDPERLEVLEKAFAVEPRNYQTAYEMGEIYCNLWDMEENDTNNVQKAINAYEQSIALNRYFPFSYVNLASIHDLLLDHDKAMPLYEKALQVDPSGSITLGYMGWHYVKLEEWEKSKEWFDRAVRLNWGNTMARNYRDIVNKRITELQLK
jgi:tetratricopeptide (TPR) repeat protein